MADAWIGALAALMLLGLAGLNVGLWRWSKRKRREQEVAWAAYAEARGAEFIPSTGLNFYFRNAGRPPRVELREEGVELMLVSRTYEDTPEGTVVEGRIAAPPGYWCRIDFDAGRSGERRLRVREAWPTSLVTPEVLDALGRLGRHEAQAAIDADARDGVTLHIRWDGVEREARRLDGAIDAGFLLARGCAALGAG